MHARLQAAFVQEGGVAHLLNLASSSTGVSWTIRAKISSLLSDLLAEAADLDTVDGDLARGLRSMEWCKATLLSLNSEAPLRTQEKALQAISYQLEPNAVSRCPHCRPMPATRVTKYTPTCPHDHTHTPAPAPPQSSQYLPSSVPRAHLPFTALCLDRPSGLVGMLDGLNEQGAHGREEGLLSGSHRAD